MGIEETLKVEEISFNLFNPNKMSEEKYAALKESILQDGIQQPVIVRKVADDLYELIDGENRIRIAKELKIQNVKALVKSAVKDADAMRLCYKINADRGMLDCFKEGIFFDLLRQTGLDTKGISKEYGLSEQFVKDRMTLLTIREDEKELLIKKVAKDAELDGTHWLAYAKAKPEVRIELCKTIGRFGKISFRDIEDQARRAEGEIKQRKEFEETLEKAEFKTCPKCKGKATGLDWRKHLKCAQYHDWDSKTGKSEQETIGGSYNKTEKQKKPKFRRNLEIEIDWPRAYNDAQEFVLKNLGEINSISFTDKNKKDWNLSMSRDKDFGHISIRREHETEFQLVRNYRGKDGSSVCGPAAGEITKKDYEGMLQLVKQFKGKVIDKRIEKKETKKAVCKKCGKPFSEQEKKAGWKICEHCEAKKAAKKKVVK